MGFGRGAQVGKTSLLKVNLYGASVDVGRIHFLFGMLQALGSHQNPRYLEEDDAFLLQCEAKIVRRHTSIVLQQGLRPRRFDITVKDAPELRFEPVSFLFLDFFLIFQLRLTL